MKSQNPLLIAFALGVFYLATGCTDTPDFPTEGYPSARPTTPLTHPQGARQETPPNLPQGETAATPQSTTPQGSQSYPTQSQKIPSLKLYKVDSIDQIPQGSFGLFQIYGEIKVNGKKMFEVLHVMAVPGFWSEDDIEKIRISKAWKQNQNQNQGQNQKEIEAIRLVTPTRLLPRKGTVEGPSYYFRQLFSGPVTDPEAIVQMWTIDVNPESFRKEVENSESRGLAKELFRIEEIFRNSETRGTEGHRMEKAKIFDKAEILVVPAVKWAVLVVNRELPEDHTKISIFLFYVDVESLATPDTTISAEPDKDKFTEIAL